MHPLVSFFLYNQSTLIIIELLVMIYMHLSLISPLNAIDFKSSIQFNVIFINFVFIHLLKHFIITATIIMHTISLSLRIF